jgi:hypothetical protein
MAQLNFDPNSVEKRDNNYELLPAGWYAAQVVESDVVNLNSGNGRALKLTFEVIQQGYRNRKLWARLNIKHNNPEAERIAKQQLRELCEAANLNTLPDSNLLHYKPVQIRVKIRKDDTGRYEDQNEISGFKPLGGSPDHNAAIQQTSFPQPQQPAVSPQVASAPAANQAATPPWLKKA